MYKEKLDWKVIEPISKMDQPVISAHHDADGLSSAALMTLALGKDYDNINYIFPKVFGDTSQPTPPDIVVDQAPTDPEYEGVVVDHHPAHFKHEQDLKYHLVFSENKCASHIVYDSLKDRIPEEHHWKVSIGIAGDGGEDKIPTDIFLKSPELLTESGYTYGKNYGSQLDYNPQLAYVMAKSLINYGTRTGDNEFTLQKLIEADSVLDILQDSWLLSCKEKVKSEIKGMYRDADQFKIEIYGDVGYIEYSSDYRIWTAQDLFSRINKTAIALNTTTGTFSIRGPLANLFANMLSRREGINAGGHLHYAGGSLNGKKPEYLRKQIPILDRYWRDEDPEDYI